MTYCCITCEFDKARANNGPGRRNLRPMIPPVAVTRDTAAGATTSSVGGETPSELARPALDLGRRAILIEEDEARAEVAATRLSRTQDTLFSEVIA